RHHLLSTLFPYTTLFRSLLHPSNPAIRRTPRSLMCTAIRLRVDRPAVPVAPAAAPAGRRRARQPSGASRMRPIAPAHPWGEAGRSEEHTSELQSRENLVC